MTDFRAAKRLLARRFPGRDRRRVNEFLDVSAGARTAGPFAPWHEPTRLFFPGLRAQPWWDTDEFSWAREIAGLAPAIRDEYAALIREPGGFSPYVDPHTGDLGWPGWKTRHVYRGPAGPEAGPGAGSNTVLAITRSNCGPREGMFSVLSPGTHLKPHTGGVNLVLTVHLPLLVPQGDLALRVAGETRRWRSGEVLAFDDSFVHEAWNFADESRVVLLWDIWHPDLTEDEVDMLRVLITETDLMGVLS